MIQVVKENTPHQLLIRLITPNSSFLISTLKIIHNYSSHYKALYTYHLTKFSKSPVMLGYYQIKKKTKKTLKISD